MNDVILSPGELHKIRDKFPGKVPIFVFKSPNCGRELPDIQKKKYLVSSHFTLGHLLFIIRKQLSLAPEKALFLFVNNTLPAASQTIAELYAQHRSFDGALRIYYTSESTFGSDMTI